MNNEIDGTAKVIYQAFYPSQPLDWEQLGNAIQEMYRSAARATIRHLRTVDTPT